MCAQIASLDGGKNKLKEEEDDERRVGIEFRERTAMLNSLSALWLN